MPNDIQIVPYDPARKTEVVELLNVCLAPKATGCRDEGYWTWKHEQNPFGRSLLLLAVCDDRLVGVRAFMRWRLLCGAETIEAAKPVDTVTHPEYQRRGIFSRLTTRACESARDEGIRLIFNTPNANSAPGYLKLGWKPVSQLPLYARWLRPMSSAWSILRWKTGLRPVPPAEAYFHERPVPAGDVFAAGADLTPLIDGPLGDRPLQTKRSVDLLRWRYAQHPHIPYFTETVGAESQPDGVLFCRTNLRSGLREIMIDDILTRDEDRDTQLKLIRQLCSRASADYIVSHAAADSPLMATLRSLGFRRVPRRRITLVARPLIDGFRPDPFDSGNWSLCLGDIEGL